MRAGSVPAPRRAASCHAHLPARHTDRHFWLAARSGLQEKARPATGRRGWQVCAWQIPQWATEDGKFPLREQARLERLSAARLGSRRSALKSVHWTDLTGFAGRASPMEKSDRTPYKAPMAAFLKMHGLGN